MALLPVGGIGKAEEAQLNNHKSCYWHSKVVDQMGKGKFMWRVGSQLLAFPLMGNTQM